MVRRTAVALALVGLVLLGVGAQQAVGGEPQCFVCFCADGGNHATKCSTAPLVDFDSQCPACVNEHIIVQSPIACDGIADCGPFLSRAPALSNIPLAGLGLLLVGGGIWLTRKRTRSAS